MGEREIEEERAKRETMRNAGRHKSEREGKIERKGEREREGRLRMVRGRARERREREEKTVEQ